MASAPSICSSALLTACLLLGLCCGACYSSYSPRVPREVATTCPNLSGRFHYPGRGAAEPVCAFDIPAPDRVDLPLPTADGFALVEYAATVELAQRGCEEILITIRPDKPSPQAWEQSGHVDLVRSRRADEVRWEADAVFVRRKIKLVGPILFPLPLPGVAYMEVTLAKQASGGLLLRATFIDSGPGGLFGKRYDRECLLPEQSKAEARP